MTVSFTKTPKWEETLYSWQQNSVYLATAFRYFVDELIVNVDLEFLFERGQCYVGDILGGARIDVVRNRLEEFFRRGRSMLDFFDTNDDIFSL